MCSGMGSRIKNNRTMVPLRFVSEVFDAQINWIAELNLVVVTTPGHSIVEPPAPPQSATNGTSTLRQGTWIWDATIIKTDQDKILQFARDNQLTAIYLQIDKDIPQPVYQNFIRRAKEKQIKVEGLMAAPNGLLPIIRTK